MTHTQREREERKRARVEIIGNRGHSFEDEKQKNVKRNNRRKKGWMDDLECLNLEKPARNIGKRYWEVEVH